MSMTLDAQTPRIFTKSFDPHPRAAEPRLELAIGARQYDHEGPPPRRLVLVTDAWHPQTNGVVNTLSRVVAHLETQGTKVLVIAPDGHRTVALPSYPQIRVAYDPWNAIRRIRQFEPDAIHVATEGPLGFWTCGWLRRHGLHFTTSFHTRYPEYLSARLPVPIGWGYRLERWFHGQAEHTFVSARSLMVELREKRVGRHLVYWPRGVDAEVFNPESRDDAVYPWPRPIWLYVGRVAIEKSIEDFLNLPLPGTKVVVGDGPSRADLQRRFPQAVWRGWQFGQDLAAHYSSADCFVFPSRTDTFGMVVLEALASGLPVASVPAPGPDDLIVETINGAIDANLMRACLRALGCPRGQTRASALRYTLHASHEVFRKHLVSLSPRNKARAPGVAAAA